MGICNSAREINWKCFMIKYVVIVFALIVLIVPAAGASINGSVEKENFFNENMLGFSKIYVDGFGVNSNGFKLILRTYERQLGTSYKPLLADIEYILMTGEQVVYSKRVEQVPLSTEVEGVIVLDHHGQVALERGRNYTGLAKVYLYKGGVPEYYLTTSSNFIARNDAEITEVYGDGIGASATIKSRSMVPMDAKIIFTLKQNGITMETREIAAPSIMSNDKEKTVNVLWTNNLDKGTYMVLVLLEGKDIIINYDKTFTVEKKAIIETPKPAGQPGISEPGISGFTLIPAILAISGLVLIYKRRS